MKQINQIIFLVLSLVVTAFSQVTATVFFGWQGFRKEISMAGRQGQLQRIRLRERKVRPVGPTYDRYKWSYDNFMRPRKKWPKNNMGNCGYYKDKKMIKGIITRIIWLINEG